MKVSDINILFTFFHGHVMTIVLSYLSRLDSSIDQISLLLVSYVFLCLSPFVLPCGLFTCDLLGIIHKVCMQLG